MRIAYYSRICDATKEGINSGYVVEDTYYYSEKQYAIKHLRTKLGYDTLILDGKKQDINAIKDADLYDYFEDEGMVYWDAWYDEDISEILIS
jgi:hypothetical protein